MSVFPSVHPTTTATVTQRNDLTGRVTYAKSEFGLEKVEIYDTTSGDNPVKLGTTDEKGNYTVRSLTVGHHYLSFRRNLFEENKEQIEIVAAPNKNTLDVTMSLDSPNKVGGTILFASLGSPQQGTLGVKIQKQLSATTWETIGMIEPDHWGGSGETYKTLYKFQSPTLRKGTYRILVIKGDNAILGSTTITFTEDSGQSLNKNFTIERRKIANTYTLSLLAFENLKTGQKIPLPAEVTVKQISTNKTWTQTVPAKLTGLTEGSYSYSYTYVKDGKTTVTDDVSIVITGDKLDHFIRFDYAVDEIEDLHTIGKDASGCERHPIGSIQEFWFCGPEAIGIYKDEAFQPALKSIASQLTALRGKYSMSDLPQIVYIASSSYINAGYIPTQISPPPCPPPLTVDAQGKSANENIALSSTLLYKIKQNTESIKAAITHEFGHGLDIRWEKCDGIASAESRPFNDLRLLGAGLYHDVFWNALKDGNYLPLIPSVGHPRENVMETWASAFNLLESYPSKRYFQSGSGITPELKRILDMLVNFPLKEGV